MTSRLIVTTLHVRAKPFDFRPTRRYFTCRITILSFIYILIYERAMEKNKKEEENSVRERGYDMWKFVDGLGGVEKKDRKKEGKDEEIRILAWLWCP